MSFLPNPKVGLLPLSLCLLAKIQVHGYAQVIPDGTLTDDTVVTPNGDILEITAGAVAGDNLFHSFEQFSVSTGKTAFFNNDSAVDNIFARVTGGAVSSIDGLLRANGTASLFILNPNGLIFGDNAALDIGGSFVASTAESIQFADGSDFSVSSPQTSSLLSVSVPVGLQLGASPGNILVQGPGNNLFLNSREDPSVNRENRPSGLQVDEGETLALVGGDVILEGGNLTAKGGRIELGSLAEAGTVALQSAVSGFTLVYPEVYAKDDRFGNLQLSQAASLETSGTSSGGNIQLQGRNISLSDASAILADSLGNGAGGMLRIRATKNLEVTGFSFPPSGLPLTSHISADVAPKASGKGGTVEIEAEKLRITEGAQISSGTFGSGNAGELRVTVQDLEIDGGSPIGPSGLFTPVAATATGDGGELRIVADRIQLANGGQILTSTFGKGDAGDLDVQATTISLGGMNDISSVPSGLFVNVEPGATGMGGSLNLYDVDYLSVFDGAQITVSTLGEGDAGELNIQAASIDVISGARLPSALFAASLANGDGGSLTIDVDRLRLIDGGQIATSTADSGNAGDLVVRASESVELSGGSAQGSSGLFATAVVGDGEGGSIDIMTPELILRDGATVSVSNFFSRNPNVTPGQGPAGNLRVKADLILLNESTLTAEVAVGENGNIELQSEAIVLRENSGIVTDAQNTATGGNIQLNTDALIALENSDITANAERNEGGKVRINTPIVLGTAARSQLTSESDITATSDLGPEFSGTVEFETPDAQPSESISSLLPNTVLDVSNQVEAACSRTEGSEFVVTGRDSLPETPTQVLRDVAVWEDLRLASSRAEQASKEVPTGEPGEPGEPESADISAIAQPFTVDDLSSLAAYAPVVEAQGWHVDTNGQTVLVAPTTPLTQSQLQATQCAAEVVRS